MSLRNGSRLGGSSLAVVLALLVPASASAGGFEFAAAGTRSLGRGGAFAARADDPMALGYNPAMLADLPDTQLMLNSHLAFYDACVQRPGSYPTGTMGTMGDTVFNREGADPDAWQNEAFPRVCNSGYPGPSPNIVASFRLLPELGLAFGILAPSGVGNSRWGNGDGTVDSPTGLLPSPVRYALVEQDLLLFHPSIGVGWRIIPEIRVGFTFQWGIGLIRFANITSSGSGPEDPFSDIRTQLEVQDWFVPAGILSVHMQPHPNVDVMFSGRMSDSIGGVTDASGQLHLTTRTFSADPSMRATTTLDGVTLRAGQPWQFTAGVRYADRIRPRAWERGFEAAVRNVVDDPMYSENFDIELDVVYELNSQVRDFVVSLPAGSRVVLDGMEVPVPSPQPIPHGWQDVIGIRLGGDWNIVPGQIAARAGVHTEIPLGKSRYQIQDFLSGYRFGLHLGATFRFERFDVSIAYAHIFQLDTVIPDGNFRGVAALGESTSPGCTMGAPYDPSSPVSDTGCYPSGFGGVVNNGTYTAEFNVLSVQASYHFE
ncbi:MAG: hypothetical protein M3Y87_00775 [Myxococcota bacterium]|nr:hypothetical protein [Myxococcota bacterium]